MDAHATASVAERGDLAGVIRAGFFGSGEEVVKAEVALTQLISDLDQLDAAVRRYAAKYGEEVVDPLTELRMRLQRGE